MDERKVHWYCFTYRGRINGMDGTASTYTGYLDNLVTLRMINENKKNAGVSDNAVLLACSYLGHMTEDEFKNG